MPGGILTTIGAVVAASAVAPGAPAGHVRTLTYRFGPIDVGPYQAVKDSSRVRTPAADGSIVRMSARVVDSSGRVLPQSQVMLHHLVFFDAGRPGAPRRDNTCGSRRTPQRFFGSSEELRDLTLPAGYGYPTSARDRWTSSWMLMNHTHRARRAYVRYRVTIDTRDRLKSVEPYWVSVAACGPDPQYSVPGGGAPGSTATRTRGWRVPHSGRIVAVGGHLHGGSRALRLLQPRCGRTLVTSRPAYGQADNPVYRVTPLLHEPDPLDISWWQSATGIPVVAGERLVVAADYDGQFPHMRVMGIDHVYLARDSRAGRACRPLPADAQELGPAWLGRPAPPRVRLTLAQLSSDGYAHPVARAPGTTARYDGPATVAERNVAFAPANLSIPAGTRVRWTFHDPDDHDVTLNSGPVGFAAPWSSSGATYSRRFDVPGTYRLYCSLHPATMAQVVTVRPR